MNKRRILRYLLTGGTAFVLEISILFFFKHVLGLSSVVSVAISFWAGLIIAFVLQKFIAFENHEKQPKKVSKQMAAYAALVAWNYVFTLLMTAWLSKHLSVYVVRTITMGIVACWNYVVYAKLFKDDASESPIVF